MPRVYTRKFDWNEAQRLRSEGWTYQKIADKLGVTYNAIYYACNPDSYARESRRRSEWQKNGVCPRCGKKASRNASTGQNHCRECAAALAATSVRPDLLRCVMCRQWLADENFPHERSNKHRRHRHDACRACNTILKRRWRAKNPDYERGYQRRRRATA